MSCESKDVLLDFAQKYRLFREYAERLGWGDYSNRMRAETSKFQTRFGGSIAKVRDFKTERVQKSNLVYHLDDFFYDIP